MAPLPLSFGLSSNRGRYRLDSSVSIINAYAEPLGQGGKSQVALYAAPGLELFVNLGGGPFRGAFRHRSNLYPIAGQALYRVDSSGNAAGVGSVPGSGPVQVAMNALADPDIMIVSDGQTRLFKNGTVSPWSSEALPLPPVGVLFGQGRFIFPLPDGRFYYSNVNSTEIFGDSFYNAEGKPDGLVTGWIRRQEIWLFGTESLEIWAPTGDESDPFTQLGGGAKPIGCASAASVVEIDDRIFWLDDNNQIRMATGYEGQIISTPFVSRVLAKEPRKSEIRCDAFHIGGVNWLYVSGTSFTLCYNLATQQWTERTTQGQFRWIGQGAIKFGSDVIVGDFENGNLYRLDLEEPTDNGTPIIMTLESPIIHAFPQPMVIYSLHVDAISGVGLNSTDEGDADPQIMLRMSYDGGKSWGGRLYERMGRQGESARVVFRQLGPVEREGCAMQLTISAEVAKCVMSALINAEAGTT